MLVDARRRHRLDRDKNASVQRSPALVQQAPVRDLVREGVLERVLDFREEPDLVHEFGGVQAAETLAHPVLGFLGDGEEQRARNILADGGRGLKQALVLRIEPVDARR
jgi:hypothetical protein